MDKSRRSMVRICSSVLAAATVSPRLLATPVAPLKNYSPVLLTDAYHRPLRCDQLSTESEYIFHYPYKGTPCFLIDMGEPVDGGEELYTKDGVPYIWKGGVGPRRSIVAFSAICAHRMTHPSPAVSFIGYRKQAVGFLTDDMEIERRSAVIQCCSEQSVYDPSKGAKVLGGPAPQPLAAIALEYKDNGELYATGVYGGALFEPYFEKFGDRLMIEYETLEYRKTLVGETVVEHVDSFTRHKIDCG
ncbi:MAG: hypothetical protein JKX75_10495 [Gammaproteobacteria bacterium]|nr:hypothetical protein [Gammaproteobacteria bacterium]